MRKLQQRLEQLVKDQEQGKIRGTTQLLYLTERKKKYEKEKGATFLIAPLLDDI